MESKLVRLKNGSEEFGPLVSVTTMALRHLMDAGKGIVVYELVELCKDAAHELWGNTGEELKSLKLVQVEDGRVHDSIRNIVLSAATGEGMELSIGDPVDRTAAEQPVEDAK